MKIDKTKSSIDIEFKNGIMIGMWECLTEIFNMKSFNWSTFQLFLVEIENDRGMHANELTIVLLCCGIRIRIPTYPKEEHEMHKSVRTSLDDIMNKSCHGWTTQDEYDQFRNKTANALIIWKTRKLGGRKRLFIQ